MSSLVKFITDEKMDEQLNAIKSAFSDKNTNAAAAKHALCNYMDLHYRLEDLSREYEDLSREFELFKATYKTIAESQEFLKSYFK